MVKYHCAIQAGKHCNGWATVGVLRVTTLCSANGQCWSWSHAFLFGYCEVADLCVHIGCSPNGKGREDLRWALQTLLQDCRTPHCIALHRTTP